MKGIKKIWLTAAPLLRVALPVALAAGLRIPPPLAAGLLALLDAVPLPDPIPDDPDAPRLFG